MYAKAYTAGHAVGVSGEEVTFDPLTTQAPRLNPANALGPFDALQTGGDGKMFSVASQTWTDYTFDDKYYNVDGPADIEFAEVTWSRWHVEAAKVYLTDAYVRDGSGNVVPYAGNDDGYGYYAGVAWNKEGIQYVTPAARLAKTQSYFAGSRNFADNTFGTDGNFGISQFNLPAEVVYATGVRLVDVTKDVYTMSGNGATYLNYRGTNDGKRVIATSLVPVHLLDPRPCRRQHRRLRPRRDPRPGAGRVLRQPAPEASDRDREAHQRR